MPRRLDLGVLSLVLVAASQTPVDAQVPLPQLLAPPSPNANVVSPFFEGWYENPDGTYTLSFGYFNRNMEEPVNVPLGEDNFIEPAQFNGTQVTHFLPTRERGAFAITIPAEFKDRDIVWTIRSGGQVHKVPGRTSAGGYKLSHTPQAAGSVPPALRFERSGPLGRGPLGITAPAALKARVGAPVPLTVWVEDDKSERAKVVHNVSWFVHQAPAGVGADDVKFEPETGEHDAQGKATATATFNQPGEYVLRVRADAFRKGAATDSRPDNQCCWTNGFVRVTVTP